MTINNWIDILHKNAVDHGFDSNRPIGETFALIHAELSEALEEDRAGRPPVWHECCTIDDNKIASVQDCEKCWNGDSFLGCEHINHKPEGTAVELVDAIIRMLDYCGAAWLKFGDGVTLENLHDWYKKEFSDSDESRFSSDVGYAHYALSIAMGAEIKNNEGHPTYEMLIFIAFCVKMIHDLGEDVEALITEKHEYNKQRPRLHGKKY